MLKIKNWVCDPSHKEALLLFLQRARELLLHTTPYLDKPATASVFLLSKELAFLVTQEKKTPHSSTQKQIEIIVEEFKRSLARDEVAKDLIGDRFPYIENCLTGSSGIDEKIEAAHLLRIRVARTGYLAETSKRLAAIINTGGSEKQRLLSITECAISAILDAGYPAQTIYHLLNITFLNKDDAEQVTGQKTLEKFFTYFDLEKHKYSVCFGVISPPTGVEKFFPENRYQIFRKGSPEYESTIAKWPEKTKNFFFTGGKEVRALVKRTEIKALDPQSARSEAEHQISLHADVLRARLHSYALRLENEAVVFRDEKNEYVQSNRPKPPILRSPRDRKISTDQVQGFFARLNLLESDSLKRYIRAVQLHSSALESKEVESQLLNIWIAFETLFVRGKSQSKVDEVISNISPYIFVNSLRADIKNLWEHAKTHHLSHWKSCTEQITDFSSRDELTKFLAMIAVKKYEPEMTEFLKGLNDDPLFRQKLWGRIKSGQKSKDLCKRIEEILTRTQHDLARIYRVRNQIVHVGYSAGEIGEIVQRAHHYLDVVMDSIEAIIGFAGGAFSIEQVTMEMEIIKKNYCSHVTSAAKLDTECDLDNCSGLHFGRKLLE